MKRILVWVLILQFTTRHNLLAELARMPSLLEHFKPTSKKTTSLLPVFFDCIILKIRTHMATTAMQNRRCHPTNGTKDEKPIFHQIQLS